MWLKMGVAVSICCCTTGDAPPPINLDTWLMCEGIGKELPDQFKRKAHDIYAIGSQVRVIILPNLSAVIYE